MSAGSVSVDPYHLSTVHRPQHPEIPRRPPHEEAQSLADVYRMLLERLVVAQEELERDQESWALMLLRAQQATPPDLDLDAQIFLLRDGLDLRVREYEEECRRLDMVELRLRRCIDEAEAALELDAVEASGLMDPRLRERLVEQRRVIRLQQDELDQMRFERDVLGDDAIRLREEWKEIGDEVDFGDEGFQASTRETEAMRPENLVNEVLRLGPHSEAEPPSAGGQGRAEADTAASGGVSAGRGGGVAVGRGGGVSVGRGGGIAVGRGGAGVAVGRGGGVQVDAQTDGSAEGPPDGPESDVSQQSRRRSNPMLVGRRPTPRRSAQAQSRRSASGRDFVFG